MPSALLNAAATISIGNAEIPLLGAGNIWVEDSLADDLSIKLTQAIIESALAHTAPGQLEIIVYDEGLSGLASPFWPLNSAGEKILNIITDPQDFKATLRYLRDHILGVKNVMQGLAPNLVNFRHNVDYPVEGYKLVVVSADYSMLDDETQTYLSVLMKSGPVAGVSFLIHSMTLGANPFIVNTCELLTPRQGLIERADDHPIFGWQPPMAEQLIATATHTAEQLATAAVDSIAFTEVQGTDRMWGESSADGVTFAIGKYGLQTVEVTLGDELNQRHNMLVTGAVGQGKSNLVSVIIHSLCQRYSPSEVQFYLLDFKEGITLQAFSNAETGSFLPHARVIGLEADREFGLSVLRNLFGIYKERMKLYKAAGVQNLRQYRQAHPDVEMPRIVVIIDEFQMMFSERDRITDEIADLLVKAVRLFRACGIHIILASQTIGGNMALMGSTADGLFGQVPIRVALKNSLSESHATLGFKNDAAAHLRSREAIVNGDYGDVSANKKTSIAYADDQILHRLRDQWWQKARDHVIPPYVFVGEKRLGTAEVMAALRAAPQHQEWQLMLGSQIEVDANPLRVPFSRDVGRNVAIIGTGDAVPVIENMMAALGVQRPGTKFVVIDYLEGQPQWDATRHAMAAVLGNLGCEIQIVPPAHATNVLVELAQLIGMRAASDPDIVVVGLGLDRFRSMPMEFQDLIKNGPPAGIHFVCWWLKLDSFRDQVGYGGESAFDIRLALRLDSQSAKSLMGNPLLEWRPADNRMLAWDMAELPEAVRVIPYSVFAPDAVLQ